MPIYVYRKRNGQRVEMLMTVSDMVRRSRADRSIRLDDGTIATRDVLAEHGGFKDTPGNWPMVSEASGVQPDQIPEARAEARRHGVDIDFTHDGAAIFRDRKHRKEYLRSIGCYDKSGGYGD